MKICNFCGKSQKEVKLMITSENGDICNECVLICMRIILDHQEKSQEAEFKESK